jgi:hypothetical protein
LLTLMGYLFFILLAIVLGLIFALIYMRQSDAQPPNVDNKYSLVALCMFSIANGMILNAIYMIYQNTSGRYKAKLIKRIAYLKSKLEPTLPVDNPSNPNKIAH